MVIDKVQKKKDFFEMRERLKELEKYIEEVDVDNRFLELDFWMDDLFILAKKHCEGWLGQMANYYRKCRKSYRAIAACYALRGVFENEGWELGILKRYWDDGIYEKTEK
ncbi:hypothetical protein A6V39_05350 [Candidatus Mycoplasma haematobovis]|uniref:Uncharacterized protein n=1 Tax=Candidatus Mycoplasma haematobovis TaxID=432608 RepID=A0A1A9QCL9_9MOLU|nr:hypothetical protein [Candidatus Mycoplasma haematobovis]OAL09761.1 hypothetical protein A6V39_05350 [Candidatus Mycoplasma haematobovis]